MRPGNQNNKRMRGRGQRKAPNPLTRTFESNGPDVKIRGTALHIAEKYQQLARDAQAAGDRVTSENYYQHAEHYLRIIASAQPQNSQQSQYSAKASESENSSAETEQANAQASEAPAEVAALDAPQPVIGLDEPQPFVEETSGTEVAETSETPAEDDETQAPKRRTRGTRGRGVRRTAPAAALPEEEGEAAVNDEVKEEAPRPRRTTRARTPRAARAARSRSTRSAAPVAEALPEAPAESSGSEGALESAGGQED